MPPWRLPETAASRLRRPFYPVWTKRQPDCPTRPKCELCWKVGDGLNGLGAWIPPNRHFKEYEAKCLPSRPWGAVAPFKLHRNGQHHIPRQKHRVTNWRDYEASLRNRGSPTIWFTEEAIANWQAQPRTTPGGQHHYSDLAIETALALRAVFRMALRQIEGLIGSIMRMLEVDLLVPNHTTLSCRACGLPLQTEARAASGELHLIVDSTGLKPRGAGEWLFEKNGTAKRRA